LGVGFERYEDKGEKSALKFILSSTYYKEEVTIKFIKVHYPSNPKSSFNSKREAKKLSSLEWKLLFAYFVIVLVTWMNFASNARELRRCALTILKTHIVMSLLIFHLDLILVLCLALTLVLCLSSLINLIITHIVLVHERTALCLDALNTTHILIVVIVFRIALVFLQEGFTPVLSRDTWTVHIFSVMVLIPLVQTVMCKRL
jgi:hypothetical protein